MNSNQLNYYLYQCHTICINSCYLKVPISLNNNNNTCTDLLNPATFKHVVVRNKHASRRCVLSIFYRVTDYVTRATLTSSSQHGRQTTLFLQILEVTVKSSGRRARN